MFLEITNTGERYHERLQNKGPGKPGVEAMDELILTWFNRFGPSDDNELMQEQIGNFPEEEKERFRGGIRRLYQGRYLQEVQ